MTMTPRGNGCECAITNEMVWAGPVIQLCHHSYPEQAKDAVEKLLDILGAFTQQVNPQEMFDKTILQMAEDYRKEAAGRLERFLTKEETAIININFMRNLSLATQMIMCTMIAQNDPSSEEDK